MLCEQVREVRDGQQQGCRVREPHRREREGQWREADVAREHDDDGRQEHGGRVEGEEHGGDDRDRHDEHPEHPGPAAAPVGSPMRERREHARLVAQFRHHRDGDDEQEDGPDALGDREGVRNGERTGRQQHRADDEQPRANDRRSHKDSIRVKRVGTRSASG
jgi:hypothetical protein